VIRAIIRIWTDFQFESLAEAETLLGLFFDEPFGESVADKFISQDPVIFPECTGIWWLHI